MRARKQKRGYRNYHRHIHYLIFDKRAKNIHRSKTASVMSGAGKTDRRLSADLSSLTMY